MIVMSPESLDEAERLCRSNHNYRVCIYCKSPTRALSIYEALLNAWHGTRSYRYFGGGLGVRFPETNSIVRIMEPQDRRVSTIYSCHVVIADVAAQLSADLIQELDRLVVDYELPVHHGHDSGVLHVDEFANFGWNERGREFFIRFENGSTISTITKAPDLGEFSPTQELQNFLNDLV